MNKWETTRRQVAITGQVSETYSEKALKGALVRYENRETGESGQATTAGDGRYWFMDLPDGQYDLTAELPNMGTRYRIGKTEGVTVQRDAGGVIAIATADIAIAATTLKGTIKHIPGGETDNVQMAQIRLKGSSELAFSDENGVYRLSALQASESLASEILVAARGYVEESRKKKMTEAGNEYTVNFVLEKKEIE